MSVAPRALYLVSGAREVERAVGARRLEESDLLGAIPPDYSISIRAASDAWFAERATRDGFTASAHWFPSVRTILVREAQSVQERAGSLLHEFGHAIRGDGSQDSVDADEHRALTEWAWRAGDDFAENVLRG